MDPRPGSPEKRSLSEGPLRQAVLDTLLVTERIFGPLGVAVQATRFIALATHPALRQESDRVDDAEEEADPGRPERNGRAGAEFGEVHSAGDGPRFQTNV